MNETATRPTTQPVKNPWGLTFAQADVMDAMCRDGMIKLAARRLGITFWTTNDHLQASYRKLGVKRMVLACLKWDRWRQTDGKDVPA